MSKQIIYHGSYCKIEDPKILEGKFTKDFGRGFYCTILEEQAMKWAKKYHTPIINQYEYHENNSLNIKNFTLMTEEWLDFIVHNRQRHKPAADIKFDAVYGNVADDDVARTVNLYMDLLIRDRLSASDKTFFINQLQFSKPNNQYCLATKKAIERLKHICSYESGR